jgi:hypothetical protein
MTTPQPRTPARSDPIQPAPATPPVRVPADYGPAGPARPGIVTAAAVLAYSWGGLTIISSLISMVAGSLLGSDSSACADNDQSGLCAFADDSGTLLIVLGSALIVAAGLVIWGGVAAWNGTNAKILVIASGIQVVIQIVWMIGTGSIAFGIVGAVVPIGIIVLILNPTSKSWFRAKRAVTF